ncbi:MAG: NrdH-redoxin, partial [Pseudomonadales bacterium]|nr:NrdH-redoxin [Pseudomonadales bacterium]
VPVRERDPNELNEFAAGIQQELQTWWQNPEDRDCDATVNTFYGPQSLHALLERCTWHSAQHVRQLMMMLDSLGVIPEARLDPEDLRGLPLPDNVWDG